ncbi:MAG: methyltransferase domain-containing protein [Anaerolineae bacterium]|nr:methyltransferase domain-containing protein [Anaerolineae bacterium]
MPSPAPSISPVTRSKQAARASYNRLSRGYDLLAGASEKRYRNAGLAMLAAQPGETILEIGFGTGQALLRLAAAIGPGGQVYGIDISDGMLALAQARLQRAGLTGRASLHCGDAANLPYEDHFFDAIFISFTLELFDTPEIPALLAECRRVLRPGGRLAVVSLAKPAQPTLAVSIYEWFHHNAPALVDCRPIYTRRSLEQAGFHIMQAARMSMWRLPVDIILAQT